MKTMEIRRFETTDAAETARIFHDAIQFGAQEYYSQEQRDAWSPEVPGTQSWREKLAALITLVAEQDGRVAGFMSMDREGHIGLAYTAPGDTRAGIASALLRGMEDEARALGLHSLSTEASHLARPFFKHHGWQTTAEQRVTRQDTSLTNFKMHVNLA